MIPWIHRPAEEKALLNPSFCSALLWQAAIGYTTDAEASLPFDLAFLVLPVILHRETREALPKSTTTSLAVWLNENPLVRPRIADRAAKLVTFTKEALLFGGVHGLLDLTSGMVAANKDWKRKINAMQKESTDEVRTCAKRAEFVGRWFAKAGSPGTVMALIGVKP